MINVGVQLAGSSGSPKWPEIIFLDSKGLKMMCQQKQNWAKSPPKISTIVFCNYWARRPIYFGYYFVSLEQV